MKSSFNSMAKWCLLSGGLIFTNCNEKSEVSTSDFSPTTIQTQRLSKLESMGFDIENTQPVFTDEGVFVEEDILLPNELVDNHNFQKQAFVSIIECNRAKRIRVKNSLGNNLAGNNLQAAIRLWNRVSGSTLKFVLVNNRPDIVVRQANARESGPGGVLESRVAFGDFPKNGRVGRRVVVNIANGVTGLFTPFDAQGWRNLLVHELGHAIGFVHTDDDESLSSVTRIPGTPRGSDGASIMIPGNLANNIRRSQANDISANDKKALRRMYSDANNSFCKRWRNFED